MVAARPTSQWEGRSAGKGKGGGGGEGLVAFKDAACAVVRLLFPTDVPPLKLQKTKYDRCAADLAIQALARGI